MSNSPERMNRNQDVVSRAFVEILNEANYDALEELYAEDFVHYGGPTGQMTGRAEFQGWMEGVHAGFSDLEATEEFSFAEGEYVASRLTYTGTHDGEFLGIPASGKHVEVTGNTINRVVDGKIVESWPETDFLGVLQQVGAVSMTEN